ncbi:hypothetical protein [Caenispirillum bisanense]|uniref:hypothetical protein n=1 Tax=Caenispirillum bisanense TaxID=414052 RepID=UPI001141A587|nr:hypothetical protein [Caenispirillum bisanense]
MPEYPVRLKRDSTTSKHPARLTQVTRFNEVAELIERHINSEFEREGGEIQMFSYGRLAIDLELPEDTIERHCSEAGGGNGITVWRGAAD